MSSSRPKIWAVIPAAGIGTRMQAERPKQYLPLFGKTLIDITLQKILQIPEVEGVVVVLNPNDAFWDRTSLSNHPNIHRVAGGRHRSDSVLSGLQYCKKHSTDSLQDTWALVHDAARPCVSVEKIQTLIQHALNRAKSGEADGAILGVPVADTVKRVNNETIENTEDRSQLWLAHTPQFFPMNRLRTALEKCDANGIPVTDEASAIEATGGKVDVVNDRRDNIKITLPEDLLWAETILKHQGFSE